jgi:hypothetical protein
MTEIETLAKELLESITEDRYAKVAPAKGIEGPGWFAIEGTDGQVYYVQVTKQKPQS